MPQREGTAEAGPARVPVPAAGTTPGGARPEGADGPGTGAGGFRLLWSAAVVSRLGDALRNAALPLLAVQLTGSPLLISLVTAAGFLPWLLFGLLGGAVADRVDQRRAMWMTDAARGVLMAGFAVAVWQGHASIGLLLAVAFTLTTLQTVFDNAATALLPSVVGPDALGRANARLMTGQEIAGRFVATPLLPVLLGLGLAVPYAADAATYLVAAALIAALGTAAPAGDTAPPARRSTPAGAAATAAGAATPDREGAPDGGDPPGEGPAPRGEDPPGRRSLHHEAAAGIRMLWRDRVLRALGVSTLLCNIGIGALIATLVLLVTGRLGAGEAGYAAVVTGYGVGSVLGGVAAARTADRLGQARALLVCGAVQTAALVVLGTVRSLPAATVALAVFGFAGTVWNVTGVTVLQQRSPARALGRVSAAFRTLAVAGAPLGALLGGVIADGWGSGAPALFCAGLLLLGVVALIPGLNPSVAASAGKRPTT
ncbi:MFS transporter [Streptomyces pactum]|uniref:MFS transporter n=1 Tax=Streptomyces pactum TaxID=68249 RepID=A0ABS0NGG0_9ACTN|nr:MFS transporter [Streptomyces pactum]MBH5334282.1 MFS transporter [Streptomyces pactum]